jgi:hypothetical protein
LLVKHSPEDLCRQYAQIHDRLTRMIQHANDAAAELSLIETAVASVQGK